jgi:hypothetical protein
MSCVCRVEVVVGRDVDGEAFLGKGLEGGTLRMSELLEEDLRTSAAGS